MNFDLRRFLAPPIFEEDAEKTWGAALLNTILWAILGSAILMICLAPFIISMAILLETLATIWAILALGMLYLLRRGAVRLANRLFLALAWMLVLILTVFSGGVRTAAFSSFMTLVVIAGLLLGIRAGLVLVGLSALAGLGLLYAETYNSLPAPLIENTPAFVWTFLMINFGMVIVLLNLSLSSIQEALRQARREIVERKRTEQALQASEEKFRAVIENIPEAIALINAQGAVFYLSPAAERISGYMAAERLGLSAFDNLLRSDDNLRLQQIFSKLLAEPHVAQFFSLQARHKDGSFRWLEVTATNLLSLPSVQAIVVSYHDITEHKQTENEVLTLQAVSLSAVEATSLSQLVEQVAQHLDKHISTDLLSIWLLNDIDQLLHFVARHYHGEAPDWVPPTIPLGHGIIGMVAAAGQAMRIPDVTQQPLYQSSYANARSELCVPMKIGERVIGVINAESHKLDAFSEASERLLTTVASQLATAFEHLRAQENLRESEERFRNAFGNAPIGMALVDIHEGFLQVNQALCDILGYTEAQLLDMTVPAITHPDDLQVEAQYKKQTESGAIRSYHFEKRYLHADGHIVWGMLSVSAVVNEVGNLIYYIGQLEDITERKRAEERIQNQLEHLSALHNIDNAIKSSSDLHITLEIFLNEVTAQLEVDAAAILLLNNHTSTLDHTASRGFHSTVLKYTKLALGEGYAGRVILERKTVHIPDLTREENKLTEALSLAGENFNSYIGSPLIAKGQVLGVLEIFRRSSLVPDAEWFGFLEILAGQAAIAIDSAQLFGNLQRSNFDLTLAYDATIEGWSRAMDLRDKETEGHTLRVTTLTMNLAQQMGIPDTEMTHIRRGALLHDIGKMGVPDTILLKPGKLTPEEWEIMHQHVSYAYDMLHPIQYLKPALDIPYYHHEKWDGTGYPNGLKGEDIPLAARIFAVVDVWDAVTSDRPYRAAWSKEKAIEHIKSESGTHFDPKVVEMFLTLISGK